MSKQNYNDHIRYYTPHHFVFYPVIGAAMAASIYCLYNYPDKRLEFGLIATLFFVIGWLSFMLRQHYALILQDRIVRLELRLRYFELTNERIEPYEARLSLKQLLALRFADDGQLLALLEQAVEKGLSPDDIKKAVANWQADDMRV